MHRMGYTSLLLLVRLRVSDGERGRGAANLPGPGAHSWPLPASAHPPLDAHSAIDVQSLQLTGNSTSFFLKNVTRGNDTVTEREFFDIEYHGSVRARWQRAPMSSTYHASHPILPRATRGASLRAPWPAASACTAPLYSPPGGTTSSVSRRARTGCGAHLTASALRWAHPLFFCSFSRRPKRRSALGKTGTTSATYRPTFWWRTQEACALMLSHPLPTLTPLLPRC